MASNTSLLLSISSISHQEAVLGFLHQTPDQQNPDLHFVNQEEEPLQIEDVRQLTTDMTRSPYQSPQSIFVILHIDTASLPAQNALLKSLEEPPAHVQIILTTNRPENVLATIQSRCILKKIETFASTEKSQEHTDFQSLLDELQGSRSTALTLSEKYKDRAEALQFLQQLASFLHQKNQQHPQTNSIQALRATVITQDFIEKNANVRLALEDLFFQFQSIFAKNAHSASPSHLA
jgi:DNA polymerase III delta prime subunit